jgi:mono/diheme cytochrome c family protein
MKHVLMACVALVAAFALGACDQSNDQSKAQKAAKAAPAAAASDPVPALLKVPADVARGKAIFVGTCGAYCHKMTNLQSDAPYLFDCDWLHGGSDEEIFHTITHGVPGTRMVQFGGAIPDQDIWRIIAYLKSASECKK